MSEKLDEFQNFKLGLCIAVVESILLQPTVYWKNARIQNKPFTLKPSVIYRGAFAGACNEMQSMSLQFCSTRFFQKIFTTNHTLTDNQKLYSAFCGGVAVAFLGSPLELVMIQQQIKGGHMFTVAFDIIRTTGIAGLARGLIPTIGRESLYVTGMLGVTPVLHNIFTQKYDMSHNAASFYASVIGGTIAAFPSHPFDMIKTCMQSDIEKKTYHGVMDTVSSLHSNGGVLRFTRGLMWRSIGIIATVYIANECRIMFPSILFGID